MECYLKELKLSSERLHQGPKHRVKDEESYVSKVLYRKCYADPIKETTDKVGTRIVLLNSDDVNTVSSFINQCNEWFCLEQSQDIDYIREHKPTEFTYQSNHFIVKPKPPRYSDELCDLLTCEIQVRTLLQHAYAETSHDTVYKKGHSSTPSVLRALAVTMAFLETADEKIKLIYDKTTTMITPKTQLIKSLVDIYMRFVPQFNQSDFDPGIAESLFSLFDEDFYTEVIHQLDTFVTSYESDITAALTQDPLPFLFRQPIVLFAFYALLYKQYTLIEKWPFTKDSLLQACRALGISDDVIP